MINLPTKAEVYCSDGDAGLCTFIIANPVNQQITHLVVKSNWPPFQETLVPVNQVEETTPDRIRLKCTRDDLNQMKPFELNEYFRTERTDYLTWPYVLPPQGMVPEVMMTHIPLKLQNIPNDELAFRRGMQVEATDGYIGQIDELLINSNNMQVTHLVLNERLVLKHREITIPVSQIDRVNEDTIYLKLNRKSVEELPTTPIHRWLKAAR
jgi:sporulation protein YlmC with PRC-barrel domain